MWRGIRLYSLSRGRLGWYGLWSFYVFFSCYLVVRGVFVFKVILLVVV